MSDPAAGLPILLPPSVIPTKKDHLWQPTRYLSPPQPPAQDDTRSAELELAVQKQLIDVKVLKKTRPRRTVDYMGGIGRHKELKKLRPSPGYLPHMRPAPPYVINLLPPKAYPSNPSTSLCTKFVHTSTNKIRCPVNVVIWTPEGRRVLTGSTSGEFTLWNGLTFNFETILQAHDSAIRAISYTHSGAYIASADQSGIIKYFQPNMNNLNAWQAHREAVRGLSFSPDDGKFATASDDSTVRLWSFEESRSERTLTGHGWDVKCVQWHPTKGLLASGSKDNLIKFWDPRTGTCLSTLHSHKNTVQALAWNPAGDMIASASRDQSVRVFDIRAMKEVRLFKGHKKEVCSLAWHPVHPILVSGGSEGSILHWDVNSPNSASKDATPGMNLGPRATLSEAHDSNVWSLAFHPLGHLLASASNDHTTRFWSRERPGDTTSVFSGGGIKPPEGGDTGGQEDEEEAVPGFEQQQGLGPSGNGEFYDEEPVSQGVSRGGGAGGYGHGRNNYEGGWRGQQQPLPPQINSYASSGYEPGTAQDDDLPFDNSDGIPGFGDSVPGMDSLAGQQQNGSYQYQANQSSAYGRPDGDQWGAYSRGSGGGSSNGGYQRPTRFSGGRGGR
ncbi:WD40 repeat-like protein [Sistotremastrum suecicum HHB10207 ss-3]|uniref:Polyadenylation factor subunit 2 n=1 Tax=Sistotremastrum suecicum HHB10207 ss-3 TaxID=1314776 RepID=A0A166BC70_9AGAM|nr:WD40 repeat-like protein [Sistotremastrum suecicum HHB10207 ss-3]